MAIDYRNDPLYIDLMADLEERNDPLYIELTAELAALPSDDD